MFLFKTFLYFIAAVMVCSAVHSIAAPINMAETQSWNSGKSTNSEYLNRIAFGSCINQNKPAPIWDAIGRYAPQVFVLLGDNFYAYDGNPEQTRAGYASLDRQPGFSRIRNETVLLATWDDNDYGIIDGGTEYRYKDLSRLEFLNFFKIPLPRAVWARSGIYDSYWFGQNSLNASVNIILLDTRTFRSPLVKGAIAGQTKLGPYIQNHSPDATVLGDDQWSWLQRELARPAALRIIASSIQVLSAVHGFETWANFPADQRRLLDALDSSNSGRVVIISGDRHHAEISSHTSPSGDSIVEVVSSSLNIPRAKVNEPNPYRLHGPYFDSNFGSLDIDWSGGVPSIEARIYSVDSRIVMRESLVGRNPPRNSFKNTFETNSN